MFHKEIMLITKKKKKKRLDLHGTKSTTAIDN